MKRDLRRLASMAAALVLAAGTAASPLGLASAQADSGLTISGNVVGAAGQLGGIRVSGCTMDWNFCTDTLLTDENGNFALTGLVPGDYNIAFDAGPVYIGGYYQGPGLTQDYGSLTPVTAPATLANVQLAVAYKISGTLTGAAGGLSKLTVTACGGQIGCVDGTVDDAGNYVVPGLWPGSYWLQVRQSLGLFNDGNSPYVAGYYDGSGVAPSLSSAATFPVYGDVAGPTFDVPIGAVFTGSLSGSNGSLGNTRVELCSLSYGPCSWSTTDPSGSYAVSGLWPDSYHVFVDGGNNYVSGYYTPAGLVQGDYEATPVMVGPAGGSLDTIALDPAWIIQGTVAGVAGQLIEVQACTTGTDYPTCGYAETDGSGNYMIGGLAPGSYVIGFQDWTGQFEFGYYSDSGVTVADMSNATQITVPPSVSGLTVAMTRTPITPPGTPYYVWATAGDGSATVSWSDGGDGGSAITGYTVTGSDGSICESTTTTCTVTGLTNGTTYTFAVTATNAVGTSDPSDPSNPVTPVGPPPAGPVKLGITAGSHSSVAGSDFSVTVSALDKGGKVNTAYTGTVQFSSTDLRAGLPAAYTFTAADEGVHTFTLSLATAGAQSVTVGDGTLTSRKWAMSVKAAKASSLVVTGPQTATAGVVGHFKVMAIDAFGNVATDDISALSVTGSDPSMSVSPAPLVLVHGKRAFNVTFKTAGGQSLQVVDASDTSLVATFDGVVVSPAKAVSISLTGLANPATAGVASNVTATMHDRFGNVATGYVGTVHFISNDKSAALPSDYRFTTADAGVHDFTVTLNTRGDRWVTIRDTVKHSIGGRALTTVVATLP